ncbi:MAG: hypothetical protein IJO62_03030 [Clostridia bacterium]|nr:hypothetical protein [Clostridia bacterium]
MKNLKKLLVLVLAIVMCLTAMSVTSLAADFEPKVQLNRRYDSINDKMYISVTTDKPYGAIKATLAWTAGATIVEADSKFAEAGIENSDMYTSNGDNSITFVVATDNVTGDDLGTTAWADLCFDLGQLSTATFSLTDISVADTDEALKDDGIVVANKEITVGSILNSLGAQYRAASGEKKDAIRFGTKLFREEATNAVEGGIAVSCGFVVAYTDTLTTKAATLGATVNAQGELVLNDSTAMINVKANNYLTSTATDMVYSVAVYFADNSANKAKEIQVKPYVIYKDASNAYHIEFGATLNNSYNNIVEINNLLK